MRPFFGRPSARLARRFALLFAAVALLFVVVYAGTDTLTSGRADLGRVDWAWEAAIPFLPWMIWVYSSIYVVFLAAPFVLRTDRELRALAAALAVAIVSGGAAFLLFPARLAYAPADLQAGAWTRGVFRLSDRLNLDYSLAPSLHVALSATTLGAMGRRASVRARVLLALAAASIGLSTVLTHQHHVVDVLTGYALAAVVVLAVYRPRAGTDEPV